MSNDFKSLIPSPKPINFTGNLTSSFIANTIPPLAVPSNLVNTIPVILVISLKLSAWLIPFWPVVASITRRVSCGALGIILPITLLTF